MAGVLRFCTGITTEFASSTLKDFIAAWFVVTIPEVL